MTVCALVGAAAFNKEHFEGQQRVGRFDAVIAVDAGFAALEAIGCTPDIVMGDFDSLGRMPAGLPEETEVLVFSKHKDESDMELALRVAQERGFDEVVVYGALGGRLDHSLANLQLLAAFSEQGLRVMAVDPYQFEQDSGENDGGVAIGTALAFLTGPAELELAPHPGATVSVFSLSDVALDVNETGLAYPLDHATLTYRTSRGLSNELTGVPAKVSVAEGTLVVFHPLYRSA